MLAISVNGVVRTNLCLRRADGRRMIRQSFRSSVAALHVGHQWEAIFRKNRLDSIGGLRKWGQQQKCFFISLAFYAVIPKRAEPAT